MGAYVTLSCQSPRSDPLAHYQWEQLSPVAQVFFALVLGEGISGNTETVAGEGVSQWHHRPVLEGEVLLERRGRRKRRDREVADRCKHWHRLLLLKGLGSWAACVQIEYYIACYQL